MQFVLRQYLGGFGLIVGRRVAEKGCRTTHSVLAHFREPMRADAGFTTAWRATTKTFYRRGRRGRKG